jgi:hypothetical protein
MSLLANRFIQHRARRLVGLTALALTLPPLAWTARVIAVESLTLSPADVTTGVTSTGTVTLDAQPTKSVTVQLSSNKPALATVPASLTFTSGVSSVRSRTFTVQTVGGASGCAEISAQVAGSPARSALLAVNPKATPSGSPVQLRLLSNPTVGGAISNGRVTLVGVPTGTQVVNLTSSDGTVATVPPSVSVSVFMSDAGAIGTANFPINAKTTDRTRCSVITARFGNASSPALLKVTTISG